MATQDDGFSVLRNTKTSFYLGDEAYYYMPTHTEYKGETIFGIHSRFKTSGSESVSGLHFNKLDNNWIYAHNGTVSKYTGVKMFNDSYYFFKHLLRKNTTLDQWAIEAEVKQAGFSGKGILYNTKSKEIFYFCNQPSQITILDGALIFSSWKIELERTIATYKRVMGYSWKVGEQKTVIPTIHTEELDDIFIHIKNNKVIEQTELAVSAWGYQNTPYKPTQQELDEIEAEMEAEVKKEIEEEKKRENRARYN
jgi:hypothetical protein